MNVEITLNDEHGEPTLKLINHLDENFIQLKVLDETSYCTVSLEDLQSALLKLMIK